MTRMHTRTTFIFPSHCHDLPRCFTLREPGWPAPLRLQSVVQTRAQPGGGGFDERSVRGRVAPLFTAAQGLGGSADRIPWLLNASRSSSPTSS
jgi:hypothetical protein